LGGVGMNGAVSDLDAKFGRLVDPTQVRVAPCEETNTQQSIFQLDETGAARLRRIMEAVQNDEGCYLSRCLVSELCLLWVIDKDGSVILGLEEGVTSTERKFPLPRAMVEARPRLWPKESTLGHPALVHCEQARIGGEFTYDPAHPRGPWLLTNKSGRFGVNLGRTEGELEAAADLFREKGIQVQTFFIRDEVR
jgi:hypothetical protein